MNRLLRPFPVRPIVRFALGGTFRELKDPHGPPSLRQLAKLNHLGALALVEPGQARAITKADAAGALDALLKDEEDA